MKSLQGLPNPFLQSIVPSPWEKVIDVESIHQSVFETCRNGIEHVRQNGTSLGILMQGTSGSGKTHMLGRLRRSLTCEEPVVNLETPQQAFVWIRLNANPHWLWRHVRYAFVEALLKSTPDQLSQLEHLLARKIAAWDEGAGDLTQWWEFMREDRPNDLNDYLYRFAEECGASSEFIRVLEQWIRRYRRLNSRSWLLGESLPESILSDLGVTPIDDDNHAAQERQSKEVVLTLCRLAGPSMPIALCFDQIEALQVNFEDTAGWLEFGNLIRDLHDHTHHVAIITCVQAQYLAATRDRIPPFARDAMRSFADAPLLPLNAAEAADLVAARLDACEPLVAARPADADRLWPFGRQEIDEMTGLEGLSPRQVINKCANRFRVLQGQPLPEQHALKDSLAHEWETRWEDATETNQQSHSEQILADGLPLLVETGAAGWSADEDPGERDLDFILHAPHDEAKVGVSFCTQENMTSLSGRLRRLQQRFEKGDLQKLVLIRDARSAIGAGAKKTHQRLNELTSGSNGVLIKPNAEAMAALDALRRLFADAQSGDLTVGGQSVSVNNLREWMEKHLADSLKDFCSRMVEYPGVSERWDDDDDLHDRLLQLVRARSVIRMTEAAEELDQPAERLQTHVENNGTDIGVLLGEPIVLFDPMTHTPSTIS